ncbi:MAG: hypothetical protein H6585_09270 [Flavobacteriales bacterium]|nr:hypothetical protein [Flavobacteriales bacterium]MCB9448519.1 hypothetical protein [Flavobacteriales bacterium]
MIIRNVNIGRKVPSPDQIERFKDFGKLKSDVDRYTRESRGTGGFGASSMARKLIYMASAAALVFGGFAGYKYVWNTGAEVTLQPMVEDMTTGPVDVADVIEQSNAFEQLNAWRAPFASQNIDVDFTEYIVDAAEGAELEYGSGTRIQIPPHAFLNQIGRPLKGKVKVKYRELNGSMDILLAGVPMGYDTAGTYHNLQSAGMLEIRAFKGNDELLLNPDNPIRIHIASTDQASSFNLYSFDEQAQNWKYRGKDEVAVFEVDEKGHSTERKKRREAAKAEKKDIAMADDKPEVKRFGIRNITNYIPALRITDRSAYKRQGSLNFTFSDIVDIQPEMKVFDQMVWHYERGIQTDDTRFFEELLTNSFKGGNYIYRFWDHVKVTYNPPRDYLSMIFLQRENNKRVVVNLLPSFAGRFRGKTCSDLYIDYLNMQDSIAEAQLEILRGRHKRVNNSMYIQRSFSIGEFGLWSCEKVFRYKTPQVVDVNLYNEDKEPLAYRDLYCIYKEPNAVVRFGKAKRLSLDRSAGMAILAIIDDETVAYVRPDQIRALPNGAKEVDLTMKTSDDVRGTLVKLKEFLTSE